MPTQTTTFTLNRMPAITWHKFKINEAEISLPALEQGNADVMETFVPAGVLQNAEAFELALSSSEDAVRQWETGMGRAASEWLDAHALGSLCVLAPSGFACDEPVVLRVKAQDAAASVAALDVVAQPGSRIRLAVHVDSPLPGSGVAGICTRVFADAGSTVDIEFVQTLGSAWQYLDNLGAHLAEGAQLNVSQTVLGAAESYIGFACNLAGRESSAAVDTRYLGHGASRIDFNYVMRQRGVQSACTLAANGVLMDSSAKVLRGTIDLVHGAKGAVGQESETVLLVSEDARNKTVPILLCDEDDVQGSHGATIGHVNPEQLAYMRTRGLGSELTERLFALASFDYAADHAIDQQVREAVHRLGSAVLGGDYQLLGEGD